MRMIKPIALALIATCAATASLAQSRVPARPITPDQWMPASVRPYQSQEIYFAPAIYQQIPEIRLTKIEAAYTKEKRDKKGRKVFGAPLAYPNLTAKAICEAYVATLQKQHHGAAVRNFGCVEGKGLTPNPGKNTVHAAMAVHYHKGTAITENLSIVITVCEPKEKYDPQQHICIPDEDENTLGSAR